MLTNATKETDDKIYLFAADGKYSEITKPKSIPKQSDNTSKGTYAKHSILAGNINSILDIVYPIVRNWDSDTSYTKRVMLETQANNLCDLCERAYPIDKSMGNTEGMKEDELLWAAGLSMINMARQ